MADCMRCVHLPLCIYISSIDKQFRFPTEGADCGMYEEDKDGEAQLQLS